MLKRVILAYFLELLWETNIKQGTTVKGVLVEEKDFHLRGL